MNHPILLATVVQFTPARAVMACPNPRPVRVRGFGLFARCGLVMELGLIDGAAYCPRCGKILRWPRDRATGRNPSPSAPTQDPSL